MFELLLNSLLLTHAQRARVVQEKPLQRARYQMYPFQLNMYISKRKHVFLNNSKSE